MSVRFLTVVTASVVSLAACDPGAPPAAPGPRVVVVYDSTVPDERQIVAPSVLAARLGLREAGLASGDFDLRGDPAGATAALETAIADPSSVGVVVAPFVLLPEDAWRVLAEADVAVLSLNQLTPVNSVRAMVPPLDEVAATIAGAPGASPCLRAGADPWAAAYAAAVSDADPSLTPAKAGCSQMVWSGPAAATPPDAAVLTDQARTTRYLRTHGPAEGSPLGICGCVEPGSEVTPELQAFMHGYQGETGLEPGPYAAEAHDAVAVIAAAWRATGTRAGVAQAVADLDAYEGVAGAYRWQGLVLVDPGPRTYAALGWRWVRRP